ARSEAADRTARRRPCPNGLEARLLTSAAAWVPPGQARWAAVTATSGHALSRSSRLSQFQFHPRHCAGRRQQLQFASLLKPAHIRHLVRVYECFIRMAPQSALARIAFPRSEAAYAAS